MNYHKTPLSVLNDCSNAFGMQKVVVEAYMQKFSHSQLMLGHTGKFANTSHVTIFSGLQSFGLDRQGTALFFF